MARNKVNVHCPGGCIIISIASDRSQQIHFYEHHRTEASKSIFTTHYRIQKLRSVYYRIQKLRSDTEAQSKCCLYDIHQKSANFYGPGPKSTHAAPAGSYRNNFSSIAVQLVANNIPVIKKCHHENYS